MISRQSLATGILVIQLPLKALKLRPWLLSLDYSKLLMNRLTFKKNLCHVSILSSLLNQFGIHSSLHQNCHHKIVFTKFSLKVHFPPPYEHEVWHFKKVNTDHIKRAINAFFWEKSFANLDINDKVYLFNKTIKIYFQISYLTKLLHLATETHLG